MCLLGQDMAHCTGCKPGGYTKECAWYNEPPKNDSHRRSPGFHDAIKKILQKRLHINESNILRLVTYYFEPLDEDDQGFLQVVIEVKKNTFVLGELSRWCEGDIGFPDLFIGYFHIGQTKYEIWREC